MFYKIDQTVCEIFLAACPAWTLCRAPPRSQIPALGSSFMWPDPEHSTKPIVLQQQLVFAVKQSNPGIYVSIFN